jgi:hypothetical protein
MVADGFNPSFAQDNLIRECPAKDSFTDSDHTSDSDERTKCQIVKFSTHAKSQDSKSSF